MNISIESCAQVIAQQNIDKIYVPVDKIYVPVVLIGVLFTFFLFATLIYKIELAKRKRFMVKDGLEQKYEEWLHDREIQ